MAKENTHCKFSYNVLQNSALDKKIVSILEKNSLVYLYGSAYPDSFYYTKATEKISIALHNGDLNYQKLLIDSIPLSLQEEEISFLLGVISHIFLDLNIHPLVNKECKKSELCHLRLETDLDRLYAQDWSFFTKKNQRELLKSFPFSLGEKLVNYQGSLKKIIKTHFFYNRLFRNTFLAPFLQLFLKNSPKSGLFYTKEISSYPLEKIEKKIVDLEDELVIVFHRFFDLLDHKITPEKFFFSFPKGTLDGF